MSFKPNEKHWDTILEYFERFPEMATGKFSGPNGKEKLKKLWQLLATKLNSLGYGSKSADKWQKTWIDFKYNLKKKASEIKTDLEKTGGGLSSTKVINEFEQRALQILGPTFAVGIGSREVGIKAVASTTLPSSENICSVGGNQDVASTSSSLVINNPPVCLASTELRPEKITQNSAEPVSSTPHSSNGLKRPRRSVVASVNLDHSSYATRKKKTDDPVNVAYSETISLLKSINDHLEKTVNKLADLNNTLDIRLGQLCNIIQIQNRHNLAP